MMVVLSVLLYFTSSPFRITRKDLKFRNGCQGRLPHDRTGSDRDQDPPWNRGREDYGGPYWCDKWNLVSRSSKSIVKSKFDQFRIYDAWYNDDSTTGKSARRTNRIWLFKDAINQRGQTGNYKNYFFENAQNCIIDTPKCFIAIWRKTKSHFCSSQKWQLSVSINFNHSLLKQLTEILSFSYPKPFKPSFVRPVDNERYDILCHHAVGYKNVKNGN